jgi:hypothetical protein
MLVTGPAASASASARLRLIDARPGSDTVRLDVAVGSQRTPAGGETRYGQVTPYVNVAPGTATLELMSGGGSSAAAEASQELVDGVSYTAVAIAKGSAGFALKVLRDGRAKAGKARLRVVHAAPELGSPDVRLGGRTVAEAVGFRSATPYLTVDPGSYALAVARPGSDEAIFEKRVTLTAGSASTAVLAGSAGATERVILATDATITPAGAPETGLGGLSGGDGDTRWLVAALAALVAGALGGAAQLAFARRERQ